MHGWQGARLLVVLDVAPEQDDGADDADGAHERRERERDRHAAQHLRVAVRRHHIQVEVRPGPVVALRSRTHTASCAPPGAGLQVRLKVRLKGGG